MAWPVAAAIIGGAVIGAGASFIGGQKDREAAQDAAQLQVAREDTEIQRRVADAKEAGIHPLYAIGAQGAGAGPYRLEGGGRGLSQAGQQLGRGVQQAAMSYYSTQLTAAQTEETQAKTRMWNKTTEQMGQSPTPMNQLQREGAIPGQIPAQQSSIPAPTSGLESQGLGDSPELAGYYTPEPSRVTSPSKEDRARAAGPADPGMKKYQLHGKLPIDLPKSEEGMGESLEATPLYIAPWVIEANRQKYGDKWLADMFFMLLGKAPRGDYGPGKPVGLAGMLWESQFTERTRENIVAAYRKYFPAPGIFQGRPTPSRIPKGRRNPADPRSNPARR